MTRDRFKKILGIGLPIVAGMISQNIINIVDTAMVGSLGTDALAAVGMGSFIIFMSQAIMLGLSSGVQASTSRRIGEKRYKEAALSLNGGILVAAMIAIPLTIVLYHNAESLFALFNQDPNVQKEGVPYLSARIIAILAVGMNASFRGYWNGRGMSKVYLKSIVLMHVCNVIISYILIFGKFGFPELGVLGSGVGTAIATYIATFYYFTFSGPLAFEQGFLSRWPRKENLLRLIRISLPSGMQSFIFAFGFTTLYWIIGKIGTSELAAANVIINISLVCILPAMAFGLTTATLAGQSLGEANPEDAKQWGWDVVKVSIMVLIVFCTPILIFPEMILSVFIRAPETLAIAITPMRVAGFILLFEALANVLMHAQVAIGDSKRMMIVQSLIQWVFFLPAAYIAGPVLGFGLLGVWIAQGIYRFFVAVAMAYYWHKGHWATAEA